MKTYSGESVDRVFNQLARDFYDDSAVREAPFAPVLVYPRSSGWMRMTTEDSSPDHHKPMLEFSVLLEIHNPRHRLIYSKDIDIFNLVGQWIYLMSGSENVQPIAFYNPIGRRFVDEESDPMRLRATWGSLLFGSGAVARTIELLRRSPQSRRVVLPVLRTEDLGYPSRNLPCLASIQFATQAGQLNAYVTMRSQAAVGVMPYDLFILTMLHEYIAMRAELPLGMYTHFAPVCGVREAEIPILANIVASGYSRAEAMPPMMRLEAGQLALFHYCEGEIRKKGDLPNEIHQLPPYWQGLLLVSYARSNVIRKRMENFNLIMATDAFPASFLEKCSKVSSR